MHFNSILWEEQLRNKGLQCGLTRLPFSLYFSLNILLTLCLPSPSHLPTPYSPSGCPSFWPERRETWVRKPPGAFFWRSHGLQERGRAWTLVLFFLQALARIERGKERKGWRGLECGSGSGGRNVSSLFVSVCGAWWMSWVDVMTWLIAQTLNKSPILQQASPSGTPLCHCCQPTWADIVAGRAGGSADPLSGE